MASALQAARSALPRWLGASVVVAAIVLIVMLRAPFVEGLRFDSIASVRHPAYDLVARVTQSDGPLLELPGSITHKPSQWSVGDSLIGQIRHRLPLIAGHTGYPPPHRTLIDRAITLLPAPASIRTLVELTHLRWILLRPASQWPEQWRWQRDAIVRAPWATIAGRIDGWVLLRVRPVPETNDFYSGIALGWRPGFTVVGTPVAPIAAADAVARVTGRIPPTARKLFGMKLTVTNQGRSTWPVTVPVFTTFPPQYRGDVFVQATWRRTGPGADTVAPIVHELELPIDIRGGESVIFSILDVTPAEAGPYELQLAIRQRNGEGFAPPASQSLRGNVQVR